MLLYERRIGASHQGRGSKETSLKCPRMFEGCLLINSCVKFPKTSPLDGVLNHYDTSRDATGATPNSFFFSRFPDSRGRRVG